MGVLFLLVGQQRREVHEDVPELFPSLVDVRVDLVWVRSVHCEGVVDGLVQAVRFVWHFPQFAEK